MWWPLTILSTNIFKVMCLHWSKIFGSVPICTTDKDDGDEDVDCNRGGTLSPMVSLLSRINELVDAPSADFLPPWWLSVLVSKWVFCPQEAQPHTSTDHFCSLNMNPAFGLALALLIEAEDWHNPSEYCCWVFAKDQLKQPWRQASLGGTVSWTLWRKENCEARTF